VRLCSGPLPPTSWPPAREASLTLFEHWLTLAFATIGALLPIANPFSTAPVFATITRSMRPERRAQQARMAAIYMMWVLLGSLFIGALVLTFFGISIPALRVAGGLVIARVGFNMLNPEPDESLPDESQQEAMDMQDIAFTPIAMPLLSGPGSIAVTISMATEVAHPMEYAAIAVGIAAVAFVSWLVLRSAAPVVGYLGVTGTTALTRLMGLVLVCIGVQFMATGVVETLTNDAVVSAVKQAYR
jgi:multiple antibiotic resistance protein